MRLVQAAIYRDDTYTDAQHKAAFVEMAAVYVFYGQLQQRHIFGFYGQVDWCDVV